MINIFDSPNWMLLTAIAVSFAGMIMMVVAIVIETSFHTRNWKEILVKFALAVDFVFVTILFSVVTQRGSAGLVLPVRSSVLWLPTVVIVLLLWGRWRSFYSCWKQGTLWESRYLWARTILVLGAVISQLPLLLLAGGKSTIGFLLLGQVVLVFESIWQLIESNNKSKALVGAMALKESFECLNDGLAYFDDRGRLFLMNRTLVQLLEDLGVKLSNDLSGLWRGIRELAQTALEDSSNRVYVCDSMGRSWMLCRQEIAGQGDILTQLQASDVSEEVQLAQQLRLEIARLEESTQELAAALRAIESLSQERVLALSRAKVHDVLAQRASFVHRFLEDDITDPQRLVQLQQLLSGLRTEIVDEVVANPVEQLQTLIRAYQMSGLNLNLRGDLPEDLEIASVFLDVIRESVTNAVRHGSGEGVEIVLSSSMEGCSLLVKNRSLVFIPETLGISDSNICGKPDYVSGHGLQGMRFRLEQLGGYLQVSAGEYFQITAGVPYKVK